MKRLSALFLIIISVVVGVCGNHNINVSDTSIVQAIGLDKAGDDTKLSAQYLDLAKSTGATDSMSKNITSVAEGEAKSVADVVSKTSQSIASPLFFGQNKLIVLGMDYICENAGSLDYIFRGVDSRPDVFVAIAEEKAEDIISNPERNSRIPAENVYNLISDSEYNGFGTKTSVNDVLSCFSDKTTDMVIPVLKSNKDYVSIKGIAVFSGNKYARLLNDTESLGLMIVNDELCHAALSVTEDSLGEIGVGINSCRTKNTIETEGKNIYFTSCVHIKFALNNLQKESISKLSRENIKRIENILSSKVESICADSVKKCLVAKSDPFRIGKYLAKKDPVVYDVLCDNWHNELGRIKYNVKAECELVLISDNSISR